MVKIAKTIGVLLTLVLTLVAYNVLRHLVYWGATEDVSIASEGASLACTFSKPGDAGPYPAVLELLGSGPETRGGPGYRVNANNMLRHGFAILICDKRGSGDSTGDFKKATFEQFAEDAAASVHYLAQRQDVRPGRIGLFTNSESGWYAPQVATETGQVAFIINRVGPPLPWLDTVLWEVRNEFLDVEISKADLPPLLAITEQRWRFYIDVHKGTQLAEGSAREAIDAELANLRQTVPNAAEALPTQVMDYDADTYRSFAVDASYVPEHYLRQIEIPLLYVFGGTDVNVPTEQSLAFLEQFELEYRSTIDTVLSPDLGHSLVTWRGLLHVGYPPDFMHQVGEWAQQVVND